MHTIPHSADIHSFEQHGSAFWDKNGPYRTLHHINPARLQFITQTSASSISAAAAGF